MTRNNFPLFLALILSLALHALPLLPALISAPAPTSTAPTFSARLRPPAPPPPAATVPLTLPEPPRPRPNQPATKPASAPGKDVQPAAKTWTQVVRQHLEKLQKNGQFYPLEAVDRGLQGEVLVLVILDTSGQVVGARVEQSSGHALLDEAALNAVRSLRALPDDAPRQTLLPVRFRLR